MSVVIVNTLLTSVMAKLAKFERHVSLSDYTSTVTAKLALAQFLNTALIVIIVNAGYTGGGLGFLQVSRTHVCSFLELLAWLLGFVLSPCLCIRPSRFEKQAARVCSAGTVGARDVLYTQKAQTLNRHIEPLAARSTRRYTKVKDATWREMGGSCAGCVFEMQ